MVLLEIEKKNQLLNRNIHDARVLINAIFRNRQYTIRSDLCLANNFEAFTCVYTLNVYNVMLVIG